MAGLFYSGSTNIYDIIDTIAAKLITEGWTNGDATWTTTSKVDDEGRRCLKHGTDDIWLALEIINSAGREIDNSENERSKGILITFSNSWVDNMYGATNSQTFCAFETESDGNASADMATLQVQYFCWVDATGFALMGTPEANATDSLQMSFICVVERMGSKEYTDNLTNFYCFLDFNMDMDSYHGTDPNPSWAMVNHMIRPFEYESYAEGGIQFWKDQWYAFKSTGNGKVYYMKPLIFNDTAETIPIYQSEIFFKFSTESGLVDGDVVAMDGSSEKFLCKSLSSPDSPTLINYAIKYKV